MPEEDDDFIDGCEEDFEVAAISEEEQEVFALFPNGPDPELEARWRELQEMTGNG